MHLEQAIFELKASVEATSLYILICSLMDDGRKPSLREARPRWTGSGEALDAALEELSRLRVLAGGGPSHEEEPIHFNPSHLWRWG